MSRKKFSEEEVVTYLLEYSENDVEPPSERSFSVDVSSHADSVESTARPAKRC